MGILRTILIIVIAYFAIRFISRLIFLVMNSRVNPGGKGGNKQDSTKKPGNKADEKLGEYVDYEEIKD